MMKHASILTLNNIVMRNFEELKTEILIINRLVP